MISLPYVIAVMPEGENKDYMTWLYEQHYRLMYSIAWEYSKDRATVEDIVSDSVVALLQKIELYDRWNVTNCPPTSSLLLETLR